MPGYIFINSGIASHPWKPVITASIGAMLMERGLKVSIIRVDAGLNMGMGNLNPAKYGEIFITDDGIETHRDVGIYERFLGHNLSGLNHIQLGMVIRSVMEKQGKGEYAGEPVNLDSRLPAEIVERIKSIAGKQPADVVLIDTYNSSGEAGGILLQEAARLMKYRRPHGTISILIDKIYPSGMQGRADINILRESYRKSAIKGILQDIIILMGDNSPDEAGLREIAGICSLESDRHVIFIQTQGRQQGGRGLETAPTLGSIYRLPQLLSLRKLDDLIGQKLRISTTSRTSEKWTELAKKVQNINKTVKIGILGRFSGMGYLPPEEVYPSLMEALRFACWEKDFEPEIVWIESMNINSDPLLINELHSVGGILVPDIHDNTGIEGIISGIRHARLHGIPFLGIGDGMSLAIVDFARDVCGLEEAHSTKFNPDTPEPVVNEVTGTSDKPVNYYDPTSGKPGTYSVSILEETAARKIWQERLMKAYGTYETGFIKERHKYYYSFNESYREMFEEKGMVFSGTAPDSGMVEIVELPGKEGNSKFFMGVQFFPEFQSKPGEPHPLFTAFVEECARHAPWKVHNRDGSPGYGVPPISIEFGRALHSLVDPKKGAKLTGRIEVIRRRIFEEMGIRIPPVSLVENQQLKPNAYVIKILCIEMGNSEVMMDHFLAIGPEDRLRSLEGKSTCDPTYGLPGKWIPEGIRRDAEYIGCMIFDPVSVIATHITEIIRSNASDLLGLQEVQNILDEVHLTHPAVLDEFYKADISRGTLRKILQSLLKERVSIRNIVMILETVIENHRITRNPEILTEVVRSSLSGVICRDYMNNESVINVISLDPPVEQLIAGSIELSEMGSYLTLDPNMAQEILARLGDQVNRLQEQGLQPIILVAPQIRASFRKLTERSFPNLVVLSWNEIAPKVNINSVGMVSL